MGTKGLEYSLSGVLDGCVDVDGGSTSIGEGGVGDCEVSIFGIGLSDNELSGGDCPSSTPLYNFWRSRKGKSVASTPDEVFCPSVLYIRTRLHLDKSKLSKSTSESSAMNIDFAL